MATLPSCCIQDGVARSVSISAPIHYIVKIQMFSLLAKNVEKYESAEFEAGGYKWKLILYPNGNKSRNVKEHLSLYLALSDPSSLAPAFELHAVVRLFLHDQNKDNYLLVQDADGKERRLHGSKYRCGFDQFIPLQAFNQESNGYLVDDTCIIGAEVFVSRESRRGKGECLSMIKDLITEKHVWRIDNFSKLGSECCENIFLAGDCLWKMQLYPKGRRHGAGSHISLYLALAEIVSASSKIYAEFTLRVVDQLQGRHISSKANHWFSSSSEESGWPRFVTLGYFRNSNNGCLWGDACLVEAEITILGVASPI